MTRAVSSRILFLFNHDAAHQAAHIAGIAAQMVLHCPDLQVVIATGTPAIRSVIADLLPKGVTNAIEWVSLDLSGWLNTALAPANAIAPVRRLVRLNQSRDILGNVDMIVSTERTCLRVKRALGGRAPVFCYVPHGSGDRNVAYHPELAQFDLFLLSGQKLIDEMVSRTIARTEQCRLIGYPKFDTIDRDRRPCLFENDRPVFIYNPHFDPYLSSWYRHGNSVLRYFRDNADRFNLIFAPHVMLFRKRLHISPEYRIAKLRPDIDPTIRSCSNIHVDTGSARLFDMSYTLAADAYIGDVSSQVYEFLIRPRACFFLDTHCPTPPYEFWSNGDVRQSFTHLAELFTGWRRRAETYEAEQRRLFAYTIDDDCRTPSTLRGARAIESYMHSAHVQRRRDRKDA